MLSVNDAHPNFRFPLTASSDSSIFPPVIVNKSSSPQPVPFSQEKQYPLLEYSAVDDKIWNKGISVAYIDRARLFGLAVDGEVACV